LGEKGEKWMEEERNSIHSQGRSNVNSELWRGEEEELLEWKRRRRRNEKEQGRQSRGVAAVV
jgi:hypothetical protein